MNPIKVLQKYGQSVWLDYIRRSLLTSGELSRLITEDGLRGVTSNPSIFEKAIAGSTDYTAALKALEHRSDAEPMALYEELALEDIRAAADLLRPVFDETGRRDGYVSLEVSPYLANDGKATVEEARRLWRAVGRENVMIKVPGTEAGIPAIRELIGQGINVNVTLLFAEEKYVRVAQAYIDGLREFVGRGGDAHRVASVASFFVSRIDTAVDNLIAKRLDSATDPGERVMLATLAGKVATATAKLVYQRYKELCASAGWRELAARGAQTQRLLWASTSTKNPHYSDVLYVEELVGADTVNTIPPATLAAFRDHGRPRASLEENLEEACDTMRTLEQAGISRTQVAEGLLEEGVALFADAFDKLLAAVDRGRKAELKSALDRQSYKLPGELGARVNEELAEWRRAGKVRRLWARDASLWTGDDEGSWLGWLSITDDQLAQLGHLTDVAAEVRREGFTDALVLGMGGSSLCPEVLSLTFGRIDGFPRLRVLDSTDPAQVATIEGKVDLARTLFIVSSKSGSTLEPNIFKQYFMARAQATVGKAAAPSRFIAITDPGSKMQKIAESEGFRRVYFGVPSIGGRYSALSDFGMVPAAVMGVDLKRLLDDAELMVHSCTPSVPPEENPGVVLGTIMGVLARAGRDKVTLVTSPGIRDLGAWLEQLLAESTGKQGKGLIPIDRERLGAPEVYGSDRLFVYVRLDAEADGEQDRAIDALERAGHPVVRIALAERYDIGQEFFRWEIATAVAGSILGINAFNQPDVEEAKVEARRLTDAYDRTGALPSERPLLEGPIKLYADPANAHELERGLSGGASLVGHLRAHLGRLKPGDYFATLAYVEMNEAHEEMLQELRHKVRDARRVATCLGFGPRFQHSTGQAYKGGPNTGVFLQVTCDDARDIPVPGQKYSFGVVKAAQARSDLAVLAGRKRRALRVHLGKDVAAGLKELSEAVGAALS